MPLRTLIVVAMGSLLLTGCLWKRMDRFDTRYRGPDPRGPLVINPVRTDVTGDPSGAGGIELRYLPLPRIVTLPDGSLAVRETTAGEPLIFQPDDVLVGPPGAEPWTAGNDLDP